MLRHHSCIIAFAAMLVALSPAQAEDTVQTLACQGTATFPTKENPKVLPISTGIVVNLTKRALEGLETVLSIPVAITSVNEATIAFQGSKRDETSERSIYGSIDRVTGDLEATIMSSLLLVGIRTSMNYALKCRPTQRMF